MCFLTDDTYVHSEFTRQLINKYLTRMKIYSCAFFPLSYNAH